MSLITSGILVVGVSEVVFKGVEEVIETVVNVVTGRRETSRVTGKD